MDKQNEQALAAALSSKPVSYELTPRAAHVGGGWRLQLFEGAFEVGGSIYPASSSAEDDVMYEEALSDGEAWVLSRGERALASADNPSTAGADEPNAVSMLSGALNHARDALRFYADKAHFHMHQPDEWDTVSGEPQNFYEDSNNTATVENGSVAKQALEDIAHVERYASLDSPVAESMEGTAKGGITNEVIDAIARPYSGMGGVEDYRAFARALLAAPALNPSEVRDQALDDAFDRLLRAAKVYSHNYMQDEAEDEEDCVCGPKQHAEAKEVFAAIAEVEHIRALRTASKEGGAA